MTGETVRTENKYAKIGTAVHLVCEHFLRGDFELYDQKHQEWCNHLEAEGVNAKERGNLLQYLQMIESYRGKVIALEQEFTLPVLLNAWPLRGHIDALILGADGSALILDHKTNRSMEGVDVWSKKIQTIAYTWAVRKIFPQIPVTFQIGYVNLGTQVTWQPDLSTDAWFERQFAAAWQEFSVYLRRAEWPERLNSNCGWCARQHHCKTFTSSMAKLLPRSAQAGTSELPGESSSEKILWLETALKAGTKLLESLKDSLIESIQNSGECSTIQGNHKLSLKYSKRRQADTPQAWAQLMDILWSSPELDDLWRECMDDVLTFKVGGLDRLTKREARFKAILDQAVREVVSENPTLTIAPIVE